MGLEHCESHQWHIFCLVAKATLLVILHLGRAQKKQDGFLNMADGIKNVCKSVSFSQGMWSAIKDHISRSDHGLEWPWGHCSPWTMEFCHLLTSGGSKGNAKKNHPQFQVFWGGFCFTNTDQSFVSHKFTNLSWDRWLWCLAEHYLWGTWQLQIL